MAPSSTDLTYSRTQSGESSNSTAANSWPFSMEARLDRIPRPSLAAAFEAAHLDHAPLVLALADLGAALVERFHFEDHFAVVLLFHAALDRHLLADWRRRQVLHVHPLADRCFARVL